MYLRTFENAGEVTNVYLGKSYVKVDFTLVEPYSKYAKEFAQEVDNLVEETGGGIDLNLFLGTKDNIMIISESGDKHWLDSRNQNYIVGPDGNTIEKITPKLMEMQDWCVLLDKFNGK